MTTATIPAHNYKLGDIVYSSWGYEQTNINFYTVSHVTPSTVTLWPLSKTRTYTGHMTGTVVPAGEILSGKAIRRKASGDNAIRVSDFEYAHLWDGKPKHFSEYA